MSTNGGPKFSNRVARASGVVSVQAACSTAEAVVLMQSRAVESHLSLDAVANGVLDKTITFVL